MKIVHFRDSRLFVNAGMRFPACQAHQTPMDTDKSRWESTGVRTDVTCKKCLTMFKREIPDYVKGFTGQDLITTFKPYWNGYLVVFDGEYSVNYDKEVETVIQKMRNDDKYVIGKPSIKNNWYIGLKVKQ